MARRYFKAITLICLGVWIFMIVMIKVFEVQLFSIFTSLKSLEHPLEQDYDFVVTVIAMDFTQNSLCGVVRGLGQQGIALINYFITYYVIDLPLSYYMAFFFGDHISYESSMMD